MKGIRFRLTVRRLMALTVLIAVLLWGVQTVRRWQISRRAVAYYAYVEVAAFAQAVEAERRAAEARHQLAEILSVPDMQFSVNGRKQTRAELEPMK